MKKLIFLLIICPQVAVADPWTPTDTKWQVAYTAALALDCMQTRYGASHPEKFKEGNPVLGPYPSKGKIDNVYLATGLGHWGVSYILPSSTNNREIGFRRAWQAGATMIEGAAVLMNFSNGSRINFSLKFPF